MLSFDHDSGYALSDQKAFEIIKELLIIEETFDG